MRSQVRQADWVCQVRARSLGKKTFQPSSKRPLAQVEGMAPRELAELQLPRGIHGEAGEAGPAGVERRLPFRIGPRANRVLGLGREAGEGRFVLPVEGHRLLGGQLQLGVAVGPAVHPGVQERVVLEAHPQLLRERAHGRDLVGVPREGHGLELEGKAAGVQAADPVQALREGARHARDPVVGLGRHAVEAHLDGVGPVAGEEVGDLVRDLGAVGEDRDLEALLQTVKIEGLEVGPHQHLAPGEEDAEGARRGDLVHETQQPLEGKLGGPRLAVSRGLVHVAMDAVQVAAIGGLEDPLEGHPLRLGIEAGEERPERDLLDRRRDGGGH